MSSPLQSAVRLGVLLLVVRLLVDLATPLLPGAFQLDPNESVVVAGGLYHSGVSSATVQPPLIARHAAGASLAASRVPVKPLELRVGHHPSTPVPRITYLREPTTSTPSSDDD